MLEVLFDIPTLKKLYPELNRCFGFTYDDISNELTQVYAQKVFNLTQEEKELANQCKSDDGWGVDAVKFALATNENIAVAVPDSFNPATIMESYAAKLHNEESVSCALLFMAALLYRGKITEAPISEGENDNMLYQQYIHEVRPDMLKLYIALNQPKQKNGKDFITDIKIAAGGNSPILINNKNSWLENRLNDYLHQYLGVNSLEEAQQELKEVYSQKKGRKANNAAHNLIMYGTFHLLQRYSSIKTKSEQIRMTLDYMELLFEAGSFNNDENYTNAAIAYLVKQGYKPQWKTKQTEDYNFSPNNQSTEHLW